MHRRSSAVRGPSTSTSRDLHVLPPLVRAEAAAAKRQIATAREDPEQVRSASHLRAVAKHSQLAKGSKARPQQQLQATESGNPGALRSLVKLKPIERREPGVQVVPVHSNNNRDDDAREQDLVLAEIWRVATTTAKRHSEKMAQQTAVSDSNNDAQNRHNNSGKPVRSNEHDDEPAGGTTLARYRRLVGMYARRTLSRILVDACAEVSRRRLEDRSSVRIQWLARRFLGRRHRERLRYYLVSAAETIQRSWRVAVARRELQTLRCDHEQTLQEQRRQDQLAGKIQRWLRRNWDLERQRDELKRRRRSVPESKSRRVVRQAVCAWWYRSRKEAIESRVEENPKTAPIEIVSPVPVDSLAESPLLCLHSGHEEHTQNHGCYDASRESKVHPGCEPTLTTACVAPVAPANLQLQEAEVAVTAHKMHNSRLDLVLTPLQPNQATSSDQVFEASSVSTNYVSNSDFVVIAHTIAEFREGEVEQLTIANHFDPKQSALGLRQCQSRALVHPSSMVDFPLHHDIDEQTQTADASRLGDECTSSSAEISSSHDDISQLPRRRAIRLIACFLVVHCIPLVRSRLATRCVAAMKLQQLVRRYLARQEVSFRRQLHLVSRRSELQAHWLQTEAQLMSGLLGLTDLDDAKHSHSYGLSDDAENVTNDADDNDPGFEDEDDAIYTGPTWVEVLPTRSGRIPRGLRIDLERDGPASAQAPSLGLWKWSWTSERWEPNRDLFQLSKNT